MSGQERIVYNYTLVKEESEKIREIVENYYMRFVKEYEKDKNTNIELELRLGEFIRDGRNNYFSSGVSYDEFSRFYTFAKDNESFKQVDLNNYLDINCNIQDFRVRISIKGTDSIMKYCNTNFIDFKNKDTQITIKNRLIDDSTLMNLYTYNSRLGVSREDNFIDLEDLIDYINKNKKRQGDEYDPESIAKYIAETKKQYRFKQRTSYVATKFKNRFRLDLTQVKQYLDGKDIEAVVRLSDSKLFGEAPNYEVEAEWIEKVENISKVKSKDICLDVYNFMGILLQVRQDTELVIDKIDEKSIFMNFMQLYYGKQDVDKEFDSFYHGKEKKYNKIFPGAKVGTLEKDHLMKSSDKPFIFSDYTVTDKADGERYILFISSSGRFYLFNDRLHLIRTDYKIDTNYIKLSNTVFDGELIISEVKGVKVYKYYAFDCLFHHGSNVSRLGLINKKPEDGSRLKILQNSIETLNKTENSKYIHKTIINGVPILEIKAKEYKVISGEQIEGMRQNCLSIWNGRQAKYPYHLDGLIFTPKFESYPLGISWPKTLKWKPPSENSIDFLIKFNIDNDSIITKIIEGKAKRFRVGKLYCGYNVEKKRLDGIVYKDYVEKEFDIPNTIGHESTSLIKLPLDEDNNTLGIKDKLLVRHNTIVECVWDLQESRWVVNKTRLDKTQRYQESGYRISGTANNYDIAINIWKTIVNPITEEILTGVVSINDIEAPVYYTKSGSELTKPMRAFNNYIKSLMIAGARNAGESLLDLSCGVAGDIMKWKASKYNKIVGIDYSKHGIYSLDNDGAYGRLLGMKNKNDEWAKRSNINFFWGDTSKITTATYPNGICEDIKKAQATEALKQPFDVVTSFFSAHYYFENNMKIRGFVQNIYDNLKSGGYALITSFDGDSIFKLLSNKKYDEALTGIVQSTPVWKIKKSYRKTAPLVADKTSVGIKIQIVFESISDNFIPEYLVKYDYLIKVLAEYDIKLIPDDEAKSIFELPQATGLFQEILQNLEVGDNLNKLSSSESAKPFYKEIEKLIVNDDYISLRQWAEKQRYFIFRKGSDIDNSIAKGWRTRLARFDCSKEYDETISPEQSDVKEAIEKVVPKPVIKSLEKPAIVIIDQVGSEETSQLTSSKSKTKKIIRKKKDGIDTQPSISPTAAEISTPVQVLEEPTKKTRTIKKKSLLPSESSVDLSKSIDSVPSTSPPPSGLSDKIPPSIKLKKPKAKKSPEEQSSDPPPIVLKKKTNKTTKPAKVTILQDNE